MTTTLRPTIYQISWLDYVLAAFFLCISIYFIYVYYFVALTNKFSETTAHVYSNDHLIYNLALKDNKTVRFNGMTLEVQSGKIHVLASNCPHQVCVHTGWISRPSEKIICIPKKVLIDITGKPDPKNNDFDYVIR